jgi:hypothetical protein
MRRVVLRLGARRRLPPPAEGAVGALSPGVRARRSLEPRERDWNDRLRRSLEARRGYSTGATFWKT